MITKAQEIVAAWKSFYGDKKCRPLLIAADVIQSANPRLFSVEDNNLADAIGGQLFKELKLAEAKIPAALEFGRLMVRILVEDLKGDLSAFAPGSKRLEMLIRACEGEARSRRHASTGRNDW